MHINCSTCPFSFRGCAPNRWQRNIEHFVCKYDICIHPLGRCKCAIFSFYCSVGRIVPLRRNKWRFYYNKNQAWFYTRFSNLICVRSIVLALRLFVTVKNLYPLRSVWVHRYNFTFTTFLYSKTIQRKDNFYVRKLKIGYRFTWKERCCVVPSLSSFD